MAMNLRGVRVPSFLYGTAWKEDRTEGLVIDALDAGFRGLDTANQRKHYDEQAVGRGLESKWREGFVDRAELFIQTKFTFQAGQDHRLPYEPTAPIATQVAQSLASSLQHLGVTWIDSLLLHGPSRGEGLGPEDHEAWRAMEALVDSGQVKLLGVSNVTPGQLREVLELARVAPAFVQNRCYADRRWDHATREICDDHGLVYQGFSLLTANRAVLASPAILTIAKRRQRSAAEIVFRFAQQVGMLPITGTSDPDHMKLDLGIEGFTLDVDELAVVNAGGR
jgi:diketogulonate reductase-like aldo/keto reductase